jgi:hypothetical protein
MSPEILPGPLAPTVAEAGAGPPPRPKLRRSERIPDPGRWRDVIPPVLAELIADSEQFAAHRKLVERVEQATSKLAELRAEHEQAVAKDAEAERQFAAGRRAKLSTPSAPAAAEAIELAERELQLVERELPRSADRVLAKAHPFLEQAAARLERIVDEGDEQVEAAIGTALALLDERAEVSRQGRWIDLCMWESAVSPYSADTRATANTPVAAALRQQLAGLREEREQRAEARFQRKVERTMLFHDDRSPRAPDGRPLAERRREAEQAVRAAEAAR